MGLITSEIYDAYNSKIKFHAVQYGYPVNLYGRGNEELVLGDYGTVAKLLYDSEKISEGHYTTLMDTIGIDVLNGENDGTGD
jgi:hypothetical protein